MARSAHSLLDTCLRFVRAVLGVAHPPEGRLFVAVPVLVKPRDAAHPERRRLRYEVRDRGP